jgi:hypothetical protein
MGLPLLPALSPLAFFRMADAVRTEVVSYILGFRELTVKPGDGSLFIVPLAVFDKVLVTVISDATYGTFPETFGTYSVTGLTGDTLTDMTLVDGVDNAWEFGDIVEMRVCAPHINVLEDAVNDIPGLNTTPVSVASQMVAGSYAVCDTTNGAFALQMPVPSGPLDGTPAGGILAAGSAPVTFNLQTGFFFNIENGPTSITLSAIGDAFIAVFNAAEGLWILITPLGAAGSTSPGGTTGQIQFDNAGAFGGFTASGDATINTATGAVTVTSTGGTAFAPSATTDTTNASNITSGTLPLARLPAIAATTLLGNATGATAAPTAIPLGSGLDIVDGALTSTGGTGGSGTVTSVSVVSANGFAGSVADATTTPEITLSTTAAGILKGVSGEIVEATAGTDYVAPSGSITGSAGTITGSITISQVTNLEVALEAVSPGGTTGQIQYSAGAFGGFTASGDATINTSTGVVTVTSTGGVAFAPSATTDTTNASNIASGTLASGRLPAISASSITTGTLPAAQLPSSGVSASSITTGTLAAAQLPSTGVSASSITTGTLPAARLPAPTSSTLGGIQSVAAVAHQWVNSVSTAGVPALSQPAFTDISGTAATSQLPVATTSAPGVVQPDDTTITISSGVISATGGLSSVANLDVLANITGAAAAPSGNTLTSIFDAVFGSTVNGLVTRGASVWQLVSNLILPANGPQRYISGPFINVTGPGTAIADTTTQTSLFAGATFRSGQSLTIPANSLIAGDEIEIALWGTFSSPANTFTVTVLLGSTVVMVTGAVGTSTSTTNGEWYIGASPTKIWLPQVGTSGTVAGHGQFLAVVSESAPTLSSAQFYNAGGTSGPAGTGTLTTINTTGALAFDVRFQWVALNASSTIQLLGGCIKKSG